MAKSPIKFGLGEYSDEAFTLKSGNKPTFKNMGVSKTNSPNYLKNFGVGPGESPYEQKGEKGKGWKQALDIGVASLTSGLDAVYGSGTIMPSGSARLKKDGNDEKECPPGHRKDPDGNCVEIGK